MTYSTYMVRCADGTLYTGWTTDVERRVAAHNGGAAGARYTRARRPVKLVWQQQFTTKHEAMHCEYVIKQWTRRKKEELCSSKTFFL